MYYTCVNLTHPSCSIVRFQPTSTDAQEGWRQIFTERVAAETTEGRPTKMAELQVVLGLEDYGTVKTQEVYMGPGTDMSQVSFQVLFEREDCGPVKTQVLGLVIVFDPGSKLRIWLINFILLDGLKVNT